MGWQDYVAYFFGGMFVVNAVPHFVSGVMGRRFPSPFASPPGKGESSAMVNVLWGAFNLVIGYLLGVSRGRFFDSGYGGRSDTGSWRVGYGGNVGVEFREGVRREIGSVSFESACYGVTSAGANAWRTRGLTR